MADDLGYGDAGFMGNKQIRTPALDKMAANGLVFRRFYSAAPVCSPTRASCLTGRHPYRMGIFSANVGHLPSREITLQRLLQQQGYVTGHFGKWHLGTLTKTGRDSNRGGNRNLKHYAPPWRREIDVNFSTEAKVPTWDPMINPKNGKPYGTAYWIRKETKAKENLKGDDSRIIMDRALPFIKGAAEKKKAFFAVIWFHTPHLPVVGGPDYLKMYGDIKNKKKQHYCACITAMDEQIGRLRAELRRLGVADNTIICFCSDNGPEGRTGAAPGSTGGLRGRKRSLYEGGVRVPGIIEWPARIKGGTKTAVPAVTSDYLPTVLDILQLKMPDDRPLDGVSLLPLLDGKMKERPRPIAFQSSKQISMVGNRYSLYSPNRGKKWELYDLVKDRGQKNDLAKDMPKRVREMREVVDNWRKSVQVSLEGQDYRGGALWRQDSDPAEVPRNTTKIDFVHDIAPILKNRCGKCHTNGTYKGRVSFDTREDMLRSKVVVPRKSAKSELFKRITCRDPAERMPPKSAPLPAKEIALLKDWIDKGLTWETGYTFKKSAYVARLKPRRVKLPPMQPGVTHPIDRILNDYYQKHKIKPPSTCDDIAFVRRIYLDVTGQLPAPVEVDAFLKDRDPQRRNKLARRLLGERRAFADHWLTFWNDLLRNDYAGTGYIDGGRKQISGWLYKSIYGNKPYDMFVRELIDPTPAAEGFIRGIKWRGNVNASQKREIQFSQNISLVFFGANMKCASCHDSFVDSWKLKDAYGLAAVIAERRLEMYRCDKATGKFASPKFLWPELGTIDPKLPKKQRLQQLAKLVTHAGNGRFTRTIVNRIWHRFFGRGIVHPVDVMANRPWNEDLLDYIAVYLSDNDYDLKQLIEHIITTRAYQSRAAIFSKESTGQEYRFRGPQLKRMTAEQFIDAVWQITGTAPGKASARIQLPAFEAATPKERRFIRASLLRSNLLMRSLGRPNREQVVTTRPDQLTTLQALDLSNGQILADYLSRGAVNLLRANAKASADQTIEDIYRLALSRPPSPKELVTARELVGAPMTREGVADLLWCVVMLPEFQLVR